MATLSIRIPEELIRALDKHARALKLPRAEYIRRAIEAQNAVASLEAKRQTMRKASLKVRKESLRVLAEFEALHDDLP